MRFASRTLLGVATAAALIGSGFAVATASPGPHSDKADPATCSSIRTTLGGSEGGAGSVYQNIRFTNTGSAACRLSGHPGVSYVNAHKIMVGWPAAPFMTGQKGAEPGVVLQPGKAAVATMRIPSYGIFAPIDCVRFNAHLMRVVFAGKTTFLPWDQVECTTRYARSYVGQVHAVG